MGYCQLFVNGLIHIAMLPLLILSWLVLTVTRYSRFTGARLPWATLPSVVGGFCSEEYFPIVGMIESYCAYGRTLGLQFFVSIDDVEVVNLFGRVDNSDPRLRVSDGTEYDLGASQLIWSMTKIVTAVAVGIAVDRGWIRYSDKVEKHWPEFAAKFPPEDDKHKVTIADLMRHESGLWTLNERVNTGLAFDTKRILGIIQDEPCHNYGESRYHMILSGIVLGELIRRVDPKHRTLGAFIRDEIAIPLELDLVLGIKNLEPEQEENEGKQAEDGTAAADGGAAAAAVAVQPSAADRRLSLAVLRLGGDGTSAQARPGVRPLRLATPTMGPQWWLRLLYASLFCIVITLQTVLLPVTALPIKIGGTTLLGWLSKWTDLTRCLAYGDLDTFAARAWHFTDIPMWRASAIVNRPEILEVEVPSVNGLATAESLGRLVACLANGGVGANGVRILKENTILNQMLADPKPATMRVIGLLPVAFTQGGFDRRDLPSSVPRLDQHDAVYAWAGWGGGGCCFNPTRKAAACFTSIAMTWDMNLALFLLNKAIGISHGLDSAEKRASKPLPVAACAPGSCCRSAAPHGAQVKPV